mmetsp:Transcript_14728/g.47307  ORF Transcript_14728/g.47307 Transcript_14728/m.47307 type:complete len:207 (-) Transcript_14728:87-707(-)
MAQLVPVQPRQRLREALCHVEHAGHRASLVEDWQVPEAVVHHSAQRRGRRRVPEHGLRVARHDGLDGGGVCVAPERHHLPAHVRVGDDADRRARRRGCPHERGVGVRGGHLARGVRDGDAGVDQKRLARPQRGNTAPRPLGAADGAEVYDRLAANRRSLAVVGRPARVLRLLDDVSQRAARVRLHRPEQYRPAGHEAWLGALHDRS